PAAGTFPPSHVAGADQAPLRADLTTGGGFLSSAAAAELTRRAMTSASERNMGVLVSGRWFRGAGGSPTPAGRRCRRAGRTTITSDPREVLAGVAELGQLQPHPVHDPEVQAAQPPVLVAGVQVVVRAAGGQCAAEPARQHDRYPRAVVRVPVLG